MYSSIQGDFIQRELSGRCTRLRATSERGSAAVEYVGLALVIAMLMTAVGSAIDSALGERLARALVERLVDAIAGS